MYSPKNQPTLKKTYLFNSADKKEQPLSILKTAIHPTTLLFIYVIF